MNSPAPDASEDAQKKQASSQTGPVLKQQGQGSHKQVHYTAFSLQNTQGALQGQANPEQQPVSHREGENSQEEATLTTSPMVSLPFHLPASQAPFQASL